ncbi:MAG: type II secretion system protein GspL [Pseudomonadota bacterium]
MTDLAVFKLGQSPEDPVAWGAFAAGVIGEAGRVANVAALTLIAGRLPPDTRMVAVLSGEQAAMRAIPAPPKQSAKLKAAATYLLEDELAEPVDDLHIIVSSGVPRGAYAISKTLMASWLAAFDAAGVVLSEMTIDFACIGGSQTACVFVGDKDRIIASRGDAGFAAERDLAEAVAPAFIAAAGDAAIIAYGAHDRVARWAGVPIERRPLPHEVDVLALFGAHLSAKGAAANFLAGEFRRKTAQSFKLGPWRRPATLAAGLAAAAIVSAATAGIRDGRIASTYEKSAEAMHKSAFPTFSGGDIRAHSRQILADGVQAASFLELASRLTASLEGHDGVAIDRIRYDGARGQFAFSIRSDSDAGIEAFRAALDAHGLVGTDNGGYRRAGEAWIGEMSARVK